MNKHNFEHTAFIPARKGSKGLPLKNRLLFDVTADFLEHEGWFHEIIVSTDDEYIVDKASKRGFRVHHRSPELSGDAVSIKAVIVAALRELNIPPDAVMWLFYLTIVYKDPDDFVTVRKMIENSHFRTVCSFVPAITHPFNCWRYDDRHASISQYIPNNIYRRQDLPDAWMHHHYVCCFEASVIESLNDELIGEKTVPFFVHKEKADMIIEIDTPSELERWQAIIKAR
jgi:CMP-N-acetylneuraminic acid synthetase